MAISSSTDARPVAWLMRPRSDPKTSAGIDLDAAHVSSSSDGFVPYGDARMSFDGGAFGAFGAFFSGGGVVFGYGVIMFACEFQNRKHGFKK